MAFILLSGSWALILLVLGMYAFIVCAPIALIVWLIKRFKRR
jgi:hypothetical protein